MSVKTAAGPQRAIVSHSTPATRGVNSAWVRKVNAVLLMRALRRHRGASQRELSALTGLDKATVSAVTSQLEAVGLVSRGRMPQAVRKLGRPAVALEIPRTAGVVFGVRLEPDRIAVVAADLGGQILDRESIAGSAHPGEAIRSLQLAIAALGRRVGDIPQRAVGIGVPALIDRNGHILFAPNLGWRNVPLAKRVSKLLPAPVLMENDTNAAAIAEREFGSCAGVDNFIYVSGHSGVGGAIFVRGELYRGANGLAGEIGHIKVAPGGRPCACGGRGCLEAYASEPAILSILATRGRPASDLGELGPRAAGGDPIVLALLSETGAFIGRAVAGLVNALNPSQLVLGGKLAIVAPWMLAALKNELAQSALEQVAAAMKIERSPLGADAVLMGGVALALQKVDAELLDSPGPAERRPIQ